MRIAFSVLLVLNLLLEGMASATLIFGPQGIDAPGLGNQWSMHYGFAALAIASASVWLWTQRFNLDAVTPVLGILFLFHTGLMVSLAIAGDQPEGMIAHTIMAVGCLACIVTRKSWCAA